MQPPKYRISGTISALEKRNKILEENKLFEKKIIPDDFQLYFKKKIEQGYKPEEAKKMTISYRIYLNKLIAKYKLKTIK